MRTHFSRSIRLALLLAATAVFIWNSPCRAADYGRSPGQGMGPPPELAEACSGKSEGDTCSFTSPRGEESGTCRELNGQLSCCPAGGPGGAPGGGQGRGMGPGQGMGPPPEMTEACSGKSVGDACSFTSPMGEASGICATRSGVMACFPAGGPGGRGGPGGGQGRGRQ